MREESQRAPSDLSYLSYPSYQSYLSYPSHQSYRRTRRNLYTEPGFEELAPLEPRFRCVGDSTGLALRRTRRTVRSESPSLDCQIVLPAFTAN